MFPDADGVVWVTHHDIAFEGAYPGSMEPFPIRGCQVVVNGHMHLYKEPILRDGTMWCNFGSLMRTAVDALDHEPAGWEFSPDKSFTRHVLDYEREAFDLTGRLVDEASPGEVVAAASSSVFVEMLDAARQEVHPATADGAMLLDALEARLDSGAARPEVRAMAMELYRKALARNAASAA